MLLTCFILETQQTVKPMIRFESNLTLKHFVSECFHKFTKHPVL